MFSALVIFTLEIPLIKRREVRRYMSINDNDSFKKDYKFKINLLLSTKLFIFLNLNELVTTMVN